MRHVQFMQKLCRGIALVGQLGFSLITPPVVPKTTAAPVAEPSGLSNSSSGRYLGSM
jgi:hypothetical protein